MTPPSTLEFLKVSAYLIIFGYFWRLGSVKLADRPAGQAMGVING